jgi:cell division protein ZapA
MSADARTVTVKLLDKEYTISCPDGAEAELLASADPPKRMKTLHLDKKPIFFKKLASLSRTVQNYKS